MMAKKRWPGSYRFSLPSDTFELLFLQPVPMGLDWACYNGPQHCVRTFHCFGTFHKHSQNFPRALLPNFPFPLTLPLEYVVLQIRRLPVQSSVDTRSASTFPRCPTFS